MSPYGIYGFLSCLFWYEIHAPQTLINIGIFVKTHIIMCTDFFRWENVSTLIIGNKASARLNRIYYANTKSGQVRMAQCGPGSQDTWVRFPGAQWAKNSVMVLRQDPSCCCLSGFVPWKYRVVSWRTSVTIRTSQKVNNSHFSVMLHLHQALKRSSNRLQWMESLCKCGLSCSKLYTLKAKPVWLIRD